MVIYVSDQISLSTLTAGKRSIDLVTPPQLMSGTSSAFANRFYSWLHSCPNSRLFLHSLYPRVRLARTWVSLETVSHVSRERSGILYEKSLLGRGHSVVSCVRRGVPGAWGLPLCNPPFPGVQSTPWGWIDAMSGRRGSQRSSRLSLRGERLRQEVSALSDVRAPNSSSMWERPGRGVGSRRLAATESGGGGRLEGVDIRAWETGGPGAAPRWSANMGNPGPF